MISRAEGGQLEHVVGPPWRDEAFFSFEHHGSGGSPLGEFAIANQSAHAAEYGSHYAAGQSHHHSAPNRAIEQVCSHIRVPAAHKVDDLLGLLANDVKKDHINDDEMAYCGAIRAFRERKRTGVEDANGLHTF